jgi:predicted DsbA family dithiol-disulfide isomerase
VRIEKLESQYDLTVEYVNFPLHPDTPAEGRRLVDLFGGGAEAAERIASSQQRLARYAAQEGLPMAKREMTWNSRLAQELGAWATAAGLGPAFHRAAFHAYFAEGKNISDQEVLLDLAAAVGLDRKEATQVLEKRTFREQIDREWARARRAGVNAVPTFEAGGHRVVGAQPYKVLEQLVVAAGAVKRKP